MKRDRHVSRFTFFPFRRTNSIPTTAAPAARASQAGSEIPDVVEGADGVVARGGSVALTSGVALDGGVLVVVVVGCAVAVAVGFGVGEGVVVGVGVSVAKATTSILEGSFSVWQSFARFSLIKRGKAQSPFSLTVTWVSQVG